MLATIVVHRCRSRIAYTNDGCNRFLLFGLLELALSRIRTLGMCLVSCLSYPSLCLWRNQLAFLGLEDQHYSGREPILRVQLVVRTRYHCGSKSGHIAL